MRILAILQLSPPKHGASAVGDIIQQSELINNAFNIDYIRISTQAKHKLGILEQIFNIFSLYIKLTYKLLFNSYDIIYITPCASGLQFYKDFFVAIVAKLFSKGKMVYHFHNKGFKSNTYVPSVIKRHFFKSTTSILLSPLLDYDIIDFTPKNNISYLPNGIAKVKEHKKTKNEKVELLFLSNMIHTKGVFTLLEACKILKEEKLNFECNFVGPWYQIKKEDFFSFVHQNGLDEYVNHLGAAYGEEKNTIFKTTDIFVFPTYYPDECFPLVLLEAMSFGLPCVTTNIAAIPEIITHNKEGLIVPPEDAVKLAEAIKKLITDEPLRKIMAVNASQKYGEKYTQNQFELNFIQTINSLKGVIN